MESSISRSGVEVSRLSGRIGLSRQPLDSFVDEWSFMICNPLLALTSGIKFPEYFQTELHRNYFIKTNEDGFELMFIEDRICENDITKMSFKR